MRTSNSSEQWFVCDVRGEDVFIMHVVNGEIDIFLITY